MNLSDKSLLGYSIYSKELLSLRDRNEESLKILLPVPHQIDPFVYYTPIFQKSIKNNFSFLLKLNVELEFLLIKKYLLINT